MTKMEPSEFASHIETLFAAKTPINVLYTSDERTAHVAFCGHVSVATRLSMAFVSSVGGEGITLQLDPASIVAAIALAGEAEEFDDLDIPAKTVGGRATVYSAFLKGGATLRLVEREPTLMENVARIVEEHLDAGGVLSTADA